MTHPTVPYLSAVAAVDAQGCIGANGRMAWKPTKQDMERFRLFTLGKVCFVGGDTFRDLPELKDRFLIVISRTLPEGLKGDNVWVVRTPEEALVAAQEKVTQNHRYLYHPEVMVIGGASIYEAFLPLTRRVYLTRFSYQVPVVNKKAWMPFLGAQDWKVIQSVDGGVDQILGSVTYETIQRTP